MVLQLVTAIAAQLREAVLDPAGWTTALESVRRLFGGSTACFAIENLQTYDCHAFGVGSDGQFQASYRAHYARHNNLWQPLISHQAGTVFTDGSLMAKAEFQRSIFFNDWLKPQDAFGSLGCKVLRDRAIGGFVNVQRGRCQPDFDLGDMEIMDALAPTLIQAAALYRLLAHEQAPRAVGAASPPPGQGILIVDSALRIAFANKAAQAMLSADEWLHIDARGCLAGRAMATLLPLVAEIAQASDKAEPQSAIRLERGTRAPLLIRAIALQSKQPGAEETLPFGLRSVLLIISDPELENARHKDLLRSQFGLTIAEADFALAIALGDGRQAAAARRGISDSTARSHLSSIFDKTGTRRQAELVRLLLQLGIGADNC